MTGRGSCHFRQADISKVIRAAKAAGQKVEKIEVLPDGKIVVTVTDEDGNHAVLEKNPWDNW
jgi:hypothetical protein